MRLLAIVVLLAACSNAVVPLTIHVASGAISCDHAPAVHDPVEVPFRHTKNEVLIDVHIEGQGPFTFLVDTGVTGAAIDGDLAAKLGIPLDENSAQELMAGPNKGSKIYQTYIPELTIGDLKVAKLQAAALPLSIFGEKLGEPLHGILGDGFLKSRATRFDFAKHTFTIADSLDAFPEDVAEADYALPLTIDPDSDMPVIEVKLNGKAFLASIDIGSSLGLEIFSPYASEFDLDEAKETWKPIKITGGSIGEATAYEGSVPEIEIGPLKFSEVKCSLTPARMDKARKGNLGNLLWKGYAVIFDYPQQKLVFRKLPDESR